MKHLKSLIKRFAPRPVQLTAAVSAVLGLYVLLPESPDVLHWVAYFVVLASMVAYGLDGFREGLDVGLCINEELEDRHG